MNIKSDNERHVNNNLSWSDSSKSVNNRGIDNTLSNDVINTANSDSNQLNRSTMPAKDANDFRYQRLERENQFSDLQFRSKDPPVPVRQILIAFVMFIAGSVMITIGALLFTGHINAKYSDRMWPLFIIGSLLFIPGFYHVRIAYYAWRKYDGFSFEDIPNDD